jgi:pimeloyl-ACP methyl ester carboxylesterase
VLLSPAASFLPIVRQFSLRGMLMVTFTSRFLVRSFMRWLGFDRRPGDGLELMYLGLKHFRFQPETLRVAPTVFSDEELRAMHIPTLLLMGDREVIYDSAEALRLARSLIADFEGELVPRSSHDMCFSQHRIVDARVMQFLGGTSRSVRAGAAAA